ncbi:MAG: serine hydrolase domain-containing protein, partial [Gemmatimonadaceae bacterium]
MSSTRYIARSAVALLLGSAPLAAQSSPAFPAAGVDSVFAKYNRTDGPGCALGVYRNGAIAYTRGYGMAELNQGIAISSKTAFYIASTSKQFAATSLQMLAAQGKLSLDDPVRKYVPELPAYADAIKLHHLLHHTSGIRDYLGLWAMSGESFAN